MSTRWQDVQEVKPLDEAERRWLRRLEAVLKEMPSRLLLVESADNLLLVDRDIARNVVLGDGGARRSAFLADVKNGFSKVTGVS